MPLLRAVNFTVSTGAAIDIYFLLLAGVLSLSENVLPFRLNTSCREPLLQKKMSATECPAVLIISFRDLLSKKSKPLSLLFFQFLKPTLPQKCPRPNVQFVMFASYRDLLPKKPKPQAILSTQLLEHHCRQNACHIIESREGISPSRSHGTVLETLASHGSSCLITKV